MAGTDSTSAGQGHICPAEDRRASLGLRLTAPWVPQCSHGSMGLITMIHGALLCRMETCAHKTGEGAKKAVLGHFFFPNSHSFLHFPLTQAMFLLCRATCVISHIKPKVIFALYRHPVEIQEHTKQLLHHFSYSKTPDRRRGYTKTTCSQWWDCALGVGSKPA